jgi:hypothetical protein
MLVYTRKGRGAAPVVHRKDLTEQMEQQILASNEHHTQRIKEYEQKKAALTQLIEQRKHKAEDSRASRTRSGSQRVQLITPVLPDARR